MSGEKKGKKMDKLRMVVWGLIITGLIILPGGSYLYSLIIKENDSGFISARVYVIMMGIIYGSYLLLLACVIAIIGYFLQKRNKK